MFKKIHKIIVVNLDILNIIHIFVIRKGDNNEGNTWTILLRTTSTKFRCMAVDRGKRNGSLWNIHQRLSQ